MRFLILLTLLFAATVTIYGRKPEYEKAFEDLKIGKLSKDDHPNTFCIMCNLVSPLPCWDCPDLDDLPLCKLMKEYEDFSEEGLTFSNERMDELNDFKAHCEQGGEEYYLGDNSNVVNVTFGDCIKCNIVLKLVKFVNDQLLTPGLIQTVETICTANIKNCTPAIVEAFFRGIRDSMEYFYHLIGVDLLGCPEYQDFYDSCISAPNT